MGILVVMQREDKVQNIGIGLFLVMLVVPFFWLQPYFDDVMRYYYGYISLKNQGRLLTEYYYRFAGGYSKYAIVNLNFFNLLIIIVGLFFVLKKFSSKLLINNIFISVCATIAVLSSPFLLENLSYHVDNIGMMLSFIVAIYASIYSNNINKNDILITSGLIVMSVLFYQASLNVFCASVVVFTLARVIYDENFDAKKIVLNKISSFVLAIVSIVIINKIIMRDDYANNKSEMITLSINGFNKAVSNATNITNLFFSSFNKLQMVLLTILLGLAIVGICYSLIRESLRKDRDWFKSLILIVSLPLLVAFIYFPAVLFVDAVLEPRVFMSFGFVVSGLIIAGGAILKLNKLVATVSLAFSAGILMSSSAYVATAQTMNSNEERLLFRIESDIRYALNDSNMITISFLGRPEASQSEKLGFKAFPIIPRILRRAYGDSWHNPAFVGTNSQTLQYEKLSNKENYLPMLNRPDYTISRDVHGKYLVTFIPTLNK